MSGIRVSNVFAFENTFCGGASNESDWLLPPPGSYISLSLSRGLNKIYTAGSKRLDTFAYGSLSGSWSWSFTLDYNYLEPLYLAFEDSTTVSKTDHGTYYEHTFDKKNEGRVPSFTIRRKQLNSMVGGTDETVEAKGCVCKSIKFSMQAGSSQIAVSMSGVFADLTLSSASLSNKTDYRKYSGELSQFSCLYIDGSYVADVDNMSIDIDNGVNMIYSTCTPIATKYSEGQTSYGFSASAYSTDPAKFRERMFSGGKTVSSKLMRKGLAPIKKLEIKSSNDAEDMKQANAVNNAAESVVFTIEDCALRATEWQRGDGSKIMEQISGADCKHIYLTIRNNVSDPKTKNKLSGAAAANVMMMMEEPAQDSPDNPSAEVI